MILKLLLSSKFYDVVVLIVENYYVSFLGLVDSIRMGILNYDFDIVN